MPQQRTHAGDIRDILLRHESTTLVEDDHGPLTGHMMVRIYWERLDRPDGRPPYLQGWILTTEEWAIIDTPPESAHELAQLQRLHDDIVFRPYDVIIDPLEESPPKQETMSDALARDAAFSKACEAEPEDYEFDSVVDSCSK